MSFNLPFNGDLFSQVRSKLSPLVQAKPDRDSAPWGDILGYPHLMHELDFVAHFGISDHHND